ncbi:hypothetical protein PMIN06_004375 [Paraphaeosphaeria minitans]
MQVKLFSTPPITTCATPNLKMQKADSVFRREADLALLSHWEEISTSKTASPTSTRAHPSHRARPACSLPRGPQRQRRQPSRQPPRDSEQRCSARVHAVRVPT